jgi:membrane associated rhomboid family serine protease
MPQDAGFGFRFRRPTPVVGATLVVLLAVWIVSAIATRTEAGVDVFRALMLQPDLVLQGRHLWSVLTYALLHSLDDTGHLLFNGLIFYFFAPELEALWGRARFGLFMLLTALGGSAFVVAASAVGLSSSASVLGFSGVVMGVTIAWGLTYPDREMFLLFFRLKGLHLVYVTIGLQILTALSREPISAATHFGGMAAGALFVTIQSGSVRRWWLKRRLAHLQAESASLSGLRDGRAARRASGPALRVIQGGGGDPPKDKRYLN